MSCFLCHGQLELFGPSSAYVYHRCQNCRTIQLFPMPDELEMMSAYQAEYASGKQLEKYVDPEWARGVLKPYCIAMMKTLRDHKIAGLVIDCGAGWGGLIEMMLGDGLDACGVELSEQQVVYAKRRGWPVIQGDLSALQECDAKASAVTFTAVFEHLVNHARVLSDAHRLLSDDGLLITLHPTAAFYRLVGTILRLGNKTRQLPYFAGAFAPPWHTAFLSIEATKRLLHQNGFQLLEIRPAPQGRLDGLVGFLQHALESVNKMGWLLFETKWPLVTSHIFVFKKVSMKRQSGQA